MRTLALLALACALAPAARGAASRPGPAGAEPMPPFAFHPPTRPWAEALGQSLAGLPSAGAHPVLGVLARAASEPGLPSRAWSPLVHVILQRGVSLESFARRPAPERLELLVAAEAEALPAVRARAVEQMLEAGRPGAHAAELQNAAASLSELEGHFAAYLSAEDLEAVRGARTKAMRRLEVLRAALTKRRLEEISAELGLPAPGSEEDLALGLALTRRLSQAAADSVRELNLADPRRSAGSRIEALARFALDSGDPEVQRTAIEGLSNRHDAFGALLGIARESIYERERLRAAKAALALFEGYKGLRFADREYPAYSAARRELNALVSEERSGRLAAAAVETYEAMLQDNRSPIQRAELADSAAALRAWASGEGIRGPASLSVPPPRRTPWAALGLGRDNIRRSRQPGLLGELHEGIERHRGAAFLNFMAAGGLFALLFVLGFPAWAAASTALLSEHLAGKALWTDHGRASLAHLALWAAFLAAAAAAFGLSLPALGGMAAGLAASAAVAVRSFRADRAGPGLLLSAAVLALAFLGLSLFGGAASL